MVEELAEQKLGDHIDITIHERDGADLRVRSVDLCINAMQVRFSAQQVDQIEDLFHRDVADLIRRVCKTTSVSRQIVNVPDFCLRLQGLVINGYTLMVKTVEAGLRQFVIRLKRGVGNALALFQLSACSDSGLSLVRADIAHTTRNGVNPDRLFDEMLAHIYLPLVNLNSYLKHVLDGQRPQQVEDLSASVVQLKTKAEVLQFAFDRLISELMIDKYSAPPAANDTTYPALELH